MNMVINIVMNLLMVIVMHMVINIVVHLLMVIVMHKVMYIVTNCCKYVTNSYVYSHVSLASYHNCLVHIIRLISSYLA